MEGYISMFHKNIVYEDFIYLQVKRRKMQN